jgi:hypothetical protein
MAMPYHLQRLPREALEVLRFMLTQEAVNAAQMEAGTGLSPRLVGRAIRRLVNFDQIEMRDGLYVLTTDGKITGRQLLDYEASRTADDTGLNAADNVYIRRLTVVTPRIMRANVTSDMFIGVNPPSPGDMQLPEFIHLDVRVSAVGGALSLLQFSLNIPPDKAAAPCRVSLTPAQAGRPVRVRIDVYQTIDLDESQPLGGMYFDVKVPTQPDPDERAVRAVGMDLMLKPPKQ